MKTKLRRGMIAASVAGVALSSALCITTSRYAVAAETAVEEPQSNLVACEQALRTVGDDITDLIDSYNNMYKSADWTAKEIEYSSPVYLVEDNKYGMYLDFDADNGYAVITTDKKIYGLETSGDLEYLRDGREVYYSYNDGFMYVDEYKQFQKYRQDEDLFADEIIGSPVRKNNNIAFNGSITNIEAATYATDGIDDGAVKYPGQSEAGDGEIAPSKINDYVAARYPGFTFSAKENGMVSSFEYSHQINTSYYVKKYDAFTYSEGNCSLNAMYNVMRDWSKRGYIELPHSKTDNILSTILNDSLYATYGKGNKTGKDAEGNYKWVINDGSYLSDMPALYSNIRSYALKKGYTPEKGYARSNVPATMEYVANFLYDNNLGVEHTTAVSTVTTKIWTNRCCYLSISGSSTYGNHGVAAVGYYKYSKETKINDSYSIMEYMYFYEIADGWHQISQIFDPNTSAKPQLNFYYLARC